ncbi:MAG: phosphoribosylanthranilate isomerase [Kiritimatiellae bacterium]|nr:phosphoribosylanthranilate isomerase [Kiritimatiellia bacterium]
MKFPEIKICGLTNVEDARAALALGADYLGFVMYAKSPRGISAERLRSIRDALPDETRCIAVFVNESRDVVLRVAEECRLYAVQIHGDEAVDAFRDMPLPVWRALAVSAQGVRPFPAEWPADRYVVDAPAPGRYGGSGEVADWDVAAKLAVDSPVMLAGGLTPENVVSALQAVKPLGVDVASGVEATPGVKDHVKMKAFFERCRNVMENMKQ